MEMLIVLFVTSTSFRIQKSKELFTTVAVVPYVGMTECTIKAQSCCPNSQRWKSGHFSNTTAMLLFLWLRPMFRQQNMQIFVCTEHDHVCRIFILGIELNVLFMTFKVLQY